MDISAESNNERTFERLIRYNTIRSRWYLVSVILTFSLILFIIPIFFVLPQISAILTGLSENIQIRNKSINKLPALQKELSQIELRMNALQNSEIGKRLNTIEKALEIGELNESQIRDINVLHEEVTKINSYISDDVSKVLEIKEIIKKVPEIDQVKLKISEFEILKNDLSNFRTTVYLLVGVLFTMFFGTWFFTGRHRQTHTPVTKAGGDK